MKRILKNVAAIGASALFVITTSSAAFAEQRQPTPADGLSAVERAEIYGINDGGDPGIQSIARDLIIADATRRNLFFGMYRFSQMTAPGWLLFDQSIDWVNSAGDPATTRVWLATYNGTLDPDFSAERDGIAVYERLTTVLGYNPSNIRVEHQSSIETGDFSGFDMVVYAWIYPRDATNVMNQGVPFFTVSAAETDEMGIGTGETVMHEFRDYGYIIDNNHAITNGFAPGMFTLASGMWMDASIATGNGRVLAIADETCLYLGVSNLVAGSRANFNVTGIPDGGYVAVVYGLTEGTTNVNNIFDYCATFNIAGVNANRIVDRGFVSGGVFAGQRRIPNGFGGTALFFQAAQRNTCPDECVSNRVSRTIR